MTAVTTDEERARAWDEGCRAAEQYYRVMVLKTTNSRPVEKPVNPYREARRS